MENPASAIPAGPMGIVISNGAPVRKPAVFWAYMWAGDDEGPVHWHESMPQTRAA